MAMSILFAVPVPETGSTTETIGRPLASPAPQSLTFIDRAWASPAPKPLTFIDKAQSGRALNPSLLLARPLTSISQTPHFYW